MRELVGELYERHYGRLVGTLVRMLGGGAHRLDWAEELAQEALLRALETWPYHGVPPNPEAWLITVAKRRAIDRLRREKLPVEPLLIEEKAPDADSQLDMMFLCCHPALSEDLQVALTLQVVCGLNARQIARGLLLAEAAVAQRLVRAKRRLREAGARFAERGRVETVLAAVYLLFNEGYAATDGAGEGWFRADLCEEAIYLVRLILGSTDRPEAHALAALFLLQSSRLGARIDAATGEGVPLPEQDRSRWDRRRIAQGFAHLAAAARGDTVTAYHLEAEIAAVHAAAPSFEATDWARIVDLYGRLPASPAVALNRAVATGYRDGAAAGLAALDALADDGRHLLPASRAEFLRQCGRGRYPEAAAQYALAASLAPTEAERRYLARRRDILIKAS